MTPSDEKKRLTQGQAAGDWGPVVALDAIAPRGLALLKEAKFEVIEANGASAAARTAALSRASCILVRSASRVDAKLLDQAPHLRVVVRAGVGLDKIDLEEATRRGIFVFNTPGGNAMAAAELTFALLLALVRRVTLSHAALGRGEWERQRYEGTELAGKSLGVIGVGRIGTLVAERAKAFQMKVLAHDPFLTPPRARDEGWEKLELDEVLERADIVTLHLPLSEETRGLLGAREIALMKKGALLVNCARGGLVEEAALTDALVSGHLAGAALDVYEQEPPPLDHPLLSLEQVVHTPHLGASTEEAKQRVGLMAARLIVEFLRDGVTAGAVNSPK